MKDVNLETIIDTLSWYKIWPLNGCNHIRAKRKLLIDEHSRMFESRISAGATEKLLG